MSLQTHSIGLRSGCVDVKYSTLTMYMIKNTSIVIWVYLQSFCQLPQVNPDPRHVQISEFTQTRSSGKVGILYKKKKD